MAEPEYGSDASSLNTVARKVTVAPNHCLHVFLYII